jgi:hypothetical protein
MKSKSRQDAIAAELDAAKPPLHRRNQLESWVLEKLDCENQAYALDFQASEEFGGLQEDTRTTRAASTLLQKIKDARGGDHSPLIEALEAPETVRRALIKILAATQRSGRGRPRTTSEKLSRSWNERAAVDVERIKKILRECFGPNLSNQMARHYPGVTVTKLAEQIAARRWSLDENALANYRHRARQDAKGRSSTFGLVSNETRPACHHTNLNCSWALGPDPTRISRSYSQRLVWK